MIVRSRSTSRKRGERERTQLNMKTGSAESNEVSETDLLESEAFDEVDFSETEEFNSFEDESPSTDGDKLPAEVKQEPKPSTSVQPETSSTSVQPKTSSTSAEPKPEIVQTSQNITTETNTTSQPKPPALVVELAVLGSGLAGYSALIAACSERILPLLITGPVLGGSLSASESLEAWPGAAPNAKSSDLAIALHAQSVRLGAKFMSDSVQSIDTTSQPYTITTKLNGSITASAIIVATGLSPKTLNLKDEVSLLGRSVFTSAASINGPHKDAAVVGNDCLAINEALALSAMVSKVTLVCTAPQLSCPPEVSNKLLKTSNITVERDVTVHAYAIDESNGGSLLRGLSLKRSDGMFTINATVVVLALGFEPKVDLLPPEAKTAEGFIKTKFTEPNLKGIFAAGSIVESTPNQQIMISASGFTAANAAIRYLTAVPPAVPSTESKLAEAEVKAPASAPTTEVKADTSAQATEPTSAVSKPTDQPSVPSVGEATSSERPPEVKTHPADNEHPPKQQDPLATKQESPPPSNPIPPAQLAGKVETSPTQVPPIVPPITQTEVLTASTTAVH
ncbi:MAG: FAD-dependent oxidoreductase [Candidatus Hodgkinia cicadicola]